MQSQLLVLFFALVAFVCAEKIDGLPAAGNLKVLESSNGLRPQSARSSVHASPINPISKRELPFGDDYNAGVVLARLAQADPDFYSGNTLFGTVWNFVGNGNSDAFGEDRFDSQLTKVEVFGTLGDPFPEGTYAIGYTVYTDDGSDLLPTNDDLFDAIYLHLGYLSGFSLGINWPNAIDVNLNETYFHLFSDNFYLGSTEVLDFGQDSISGEIYAIGGAANIENIGIDEIQLFLVFFDGEYGNTEAGTVEEPTGGSQTGFTSPSDDPTVVDTDLTEFESSDVEGSSASSEEGSSDESSGEETSEEEPSESSEEDSSEEENTEEESTVDEEGSDAIQKVVSSLLVCAAVAFLC